ncbi:PLP-dependent aminotransferase family protein [Catellatospora sp. NEAU-YM18]|nr:PLP-dependent aminotransferase family protein [Catellatospora tritici]
MNFLNEVAGRYPDAISLAAGRPYEGFYDTADINRYLDRYVAYLAEQGASPVQIRRALMQYGRTNGQIHGLIARMLSTDDGIDVPAEAISVTAGCQEAMVMVLRGLCAGPDDVLLAAEPCYVGITGAARILGIEVVPVPEGRDGLDPARVAEVARAVRDSGRTPRALYLVPDFSNPSGLCLDLPARQGLLDVAEAEDLLILEDDPYGLFGLDDRPRPKLKALDTRQRVIYLGSFAKSVFPGARIGFLVADQTVVDEAGRTTLLAEELSTIKSMLTVNTSPIAQAVVGGVLVESGCSLRAANAQKIAFYRENLRGLIDALDRHLPAPWRDEVGVRWNQPEGGFFAVVDVPFTADEKLLEASASRHGVLWTPMSFFYTDGGTRSLRLSCSYLDAATVEEGVRRLAAMIRENIAA